MTSDVNEQDRNEEQTGQADTKTDEKHSTDAEALSGSLENEENTGLEVELARLKDQMLREQADMQNLRKRMQRDVEQARKFALEKFVSELLPVVDNLDRAIDAAATDDEEAVRAVVEGVELTRKNFLDVLERFQVKRLDPQPGEPFDPQYHEAVTAIPNADMEPDSVIDVMQKGYLLNDRLLRAAMVVVSRAG